MAVGYLTPTVDFVKSGQVALATDRNLPPWTAYMTSAPLSGTRTDTQPVSETPEAKTGSDQPMFGMADWYNRIHFTERVTSLGTITSQQNITLTVWNAWLVQRTLNSVTGVGDDGITLTQPGTPPLQYLPLAEKNYTFAVSAEGPAVISASYTFDFDVVDMGYQIGGIRIIPWVWRPDWARGMSERLEWSTDVLTAYDGTEQRVKLQEYPRRTFEFAFMAEGSQRRRLEAALYGWGARSWALPVWPDGEALTVALAPDDMEVMCSTATRDYHVGGLVIVLADDGSHETAEVESVQADRVVLARPIISAWPVGTMVYPARIARLPDTQSISRFTGSVSYGPVRFECEDVSEWTPATGTTYRGVPVMTDKPNWVDDIGLDFVRKLSALDFGSGKRAYADESGMPEIVQTHRWLLDGRTELANFRAWLYARAGKFAAVWVPTWADDLIVTAPVGASAVNIDVEHTHYVRHMAQAMHRRDIRIQLASGAVHYRRITASVDVNATTERLTIDSAIGTALQPGDIVQVSFMAICRLDSDGVEISYFTGDIADATHAVRAVRYDV